MTRLQRITLTIVLLLDLAMLVYPPYQLGAGFRTRDLGYHWIWFLSFLEPKLRDYGEALHVNVVTLSAQIVIVSVIGLIVFLLARGTAGK